MNADPRLQERKQPERRVFCKLGGDENCSVRNLSENGLCFESLAPIEEKDLLHLRLSVGANNPIEASGKLAWLDSAKRTGGLRLLELSAPAREQIRAWLSETSAASLLQKRDKQPDHGAAIEKLPTWQMVRVPSTQVPSTQLVPIERHRAKARRLFLFGVLLGFGTCTAMIIAISQFAGGANLVSLARMTASPNRAVQSSAAQTRAPVAQPASPSTAVSEPVAAKPLAMQPAAVHTVFAAAPTGPRQQSPLTAGASSTDLMTRRASLVSAVPQPAKAEQPLSARHTAVTSAQAASDAHSSSDQVQHSKKLPPTPQQLWSSFQAGNMKAAVALADLYARGEGVPVNCEQARILLQVASKKNNAEASKKLDELDKSGCPANSE